MEPRKEEFEISLIQMDSTIERDAVSKTQNLSEDEVTVETCLTEENKERSIQNEELKGEPGKLTVIEKVSDSEISEDEKEQDQDESILPTVDVRKSYELSKNPEEVECQVHDKNEVTTDRA